MRFLERFFLSLSRQVLPTACIVCERHQLALICTGCLESCHATCLINYECCHQCGISLEATEVAQRICTQCVSNPPYFDETHCLDRYEGVLQNALHQLKYQKRLAYAHGLATVWNHIMASQLDVNHSVYLMPVPLSTQKLALRGFNQSWEIARRIECAYIKKLSHALQRNHYESSQAGGRLSSRRAAIQGMFYVDKNYIELLQNQNVIIFDDVMTSGATLNEIARILKDNGVSRVINWVLLRTAKTAHV